MAAVDHPGLFRLVDGLSRTAAAIHRLHGDGSEPAQHFGDVRAAPGAAEQFAHPAIPARSDLDAHEPAVVGLDGRADGEGCLFHPDGNIPDLEPAIHGEAQPHAVDRVAGLDRAAVPVGYRVGLGVAQAGLEVPQPVVAFESLTENLASVNELPGLRFRCWHALVTVHCALQH